MIYGSGPSGFHWQGRAHTKPTGPFVYDPKGGPEHHVPLHDEWAGAIDGDRRLGMVEP